MNKIIGLSIFLIVFIAILSLSGDAPYYHLFLESRFLPWHHVVLEGINSLVLFLIFFKAQNIYSKTHDKRMIIVAIGFLTAVVLNVVHLAMTHSFPYDVLSMQNLHNKPYLFFLIVGKIMTSTSLFLYVMSTANSSDKVKANYKKIIYGTSFLILLTAAVSYNLIWVLHKHYDLSRILLLGQIISPAYVALFFITAFIYAEARLVNKKNIFSAFIVGLILLGIDHLFFISPHLAQGYGLWGHMLKIVGFTCILVGLKNVPEGSEIVSFKQKLLAYLYIILLVSYLIIASTIALFFNINFPEHFPQVFIEFLLLAGLAKYITTTKLIQPVLNISNHIEKYKVGEEPEKIPVISNDEIGVLTDKLNQIMNLKWEYTKELKNSRDKEALLRKIVETVGKSLDLKLILNTICKEVFELFKSDRVSIEDFPYHDNLSQWEVTSQWKSGPDILGVNDIEYSPKSKQFLGTRVVIEGKDIIADDIEKSDLPDYYIDTHKKMNIKSYIAVPIGNWGAIALSQVHNYRHWTEDEIQLLHTIASQAYIAIRQASQYARNLIESSLDPLVTISPEGKITDVNEATIKVTGIARDKLIGTDFSSYFTEPQKAKQGYKKVFSDGKVVDYPLTVRHTSGKTTDVLYNASVYKDDKGNVLGVFAAARDITEIKQASQYARSLLEASLDPLVTISSKGKITDVNESTTKVTGVSREKLIGSDFSSYFTEPKEAHAGYEQVFKQGFVTDYPLTIRSATGKLTDVLYNASVYKDDKGEVLGVFAAARDITERKKAEKQLETVNKELESFAYTVSHDLRAPLRGMDGYSLALLEDYGDKLDDTGREYLQTVRASSQKMGQLISDILNLSRLNRSEINIKSINLSAMANDIINELRKQDNTRNVECKIAENLQCDGDEAIIRVALQNLIENAWKFTKNTPNPVIEFGMASSEDNKEDNKRAFFIKDNGAGFDMRHADKLFLPFQRLHQTHEYPGTGIGLATVYGIIKRHNGRIWAESEIGKGSAFFFSVE